MAGGSDAQDKSSKTEDATPFRLEQLRKKNVVPLSKDLISSLELMGVTIVLMLVTPWILNNLGVSLKDLLASAFKAKIMSESDVGIILLACFQVIAKNAAPVIVIVIFISIITTIVQTQGLLWSFESLVPNIDKINPLTGLARLFTRQRLMETVKSFIKFLVLGFTIYFAVKKNFQTLGGFSSMPIVASVFLIGKYALGILFALAGAVLALGVVDVIYQRFEFAQSHKMSKDEIKQEIKEREGDPQIKGKVRSLMRSAANKKMMAAVTKSSALIVNPTHFAIAIEYESGMFAPKIVAKGVDYLALKMKKKAKELGIPVIENRPLARILYKTVKIGSFVPKNLYQAVAEVLAQVYRLKGRFKS